jgi:aminobenzoyl-glutamate utilization protein B
MKEKALKWIEENKDKLVKISDKIWQYAELGLLEEKSSKLLAETLEHNGFDIKYGAGGLNTAFVTKWGQGKPVIGIMGEYDALPGLSQKVTTHKEPLQDGAPGHGCGHNIHGVSGMAGAIALKYALEKSGLSGTVKFFGCPAEESASGKVWMVKDGVFDNVDVIISHHPGTMNRVGLGSSLANNSVKFAFHGKSSHAAASPELGRSSLDAVELMNIGVNFLREHVIQDARIHYIIEEGGKQPNVVPDYAKSWYLIRAPEREQVNQIYHRVQNIAKGAALMTETDLEVNFLKGVYNKLPNVALSELIVKNMREVDRPKYSEKDLEFAKQISETITRTEKIESLRKSKRSDWEELIDCLIDETVPDPYGEGEISSGSTDVSDVSWKVPTVEFGTAAWFLGTPGHSWQVTAQAGSPLGHKSLIYGAKIIAATAVDLFIKPDVLANIKEEFDTRKKEKVYESPIPNDLNPPRPEDLWKN